MWWSIIAYKMALTFTKLSFILQYLRVFVDRGTRRACWIMLIIIAGFGVTNLICSIITCLPIPYFWDKSIQGGHCFNLTAYVCIPSRFPHTEEPQDRFLDSTAPRHISQLPFHLNLRKNR